MLDRTKSYPHAKRLLCTPECIENVLECLFMPSKLRFHAHSKSHFYLCRKV